MKSGFNEHLRGLEEGRRVERSREGARSPRAVMQLEGRFCPPVRPSFPPHRRLRAAAPALGPAGFTRAAAFPESGV